jgi:hypothetical protein
MFCVSGTHISQNFGQKFTGLSLHSIPNSLPILNEELHGVSFKGSSFVFVLLPVQLIKAIHLFA